MKARARTISRLVALLVLTLMLTCSFASAQSTSLNGSLGFLITASTFMRPNDNGQALMGVFNFDGAGNVTGPYLFQIGALHDRPAQTIAGTFTGTYSSNPDGTGSVTVALDAGLTATYAMVIGDAGQSLQLVMTNCMFGSQGCNFFASVGSGFARPVKAASLNGSYAFQFSNTPSPTGTIGVAKFDGAGNVAVSFTTVGPGRDDTSGQAPVSNGTLTGTYSTNPDGTGTINVPSQGLAFAFVITDGGSGLLLVQTTGRSDDNVSYGTARLQ